MCARYGCAMQGKTGVEGSGAQPQAAGGIASGDVASYQGVELIFYGQMGLTDEADAILSASGYGRAHYRTLYVIARNPGITTSALLAKLKITNQSLSRVMGSLLRDGMVQQNADLEDRRQRRHVLSSQGASLEQRVLASQFSALKRAYRAAGPDAVTGFLRVLHELVPDADRKLLSHPLSD